MSKQQLVLAQLNRVEYQMQCIEEQLKYYVNLLVYKDGFIVCITIVDDIILKQYLKKRERLETLNNRQSYLINKYF